MRWRDFSLPDAKILIIEDESITAMEIQKNLELWGYEVVGVAGSGEKAIEIADKTVPDLVLADIILKGDMDGIDAVEHISKRMDISAIYLTAHSDQNTFKRAKITKPAGYVIKPYDEKELKFTIEIALYNKEIRTENEDINDKDRLRAVTDFILSSTPALTSKMRIEDTAGFLKEFARFFQNNMKPKFDRELGINSETRDDADQLLQEYIIWISNLFSSLGFNVQPHLEEFWIQECLWGSRAIDNKVFCLMCKAMTDLSFMWTGLEGTVEHDYRLGLRPPLCRFHYKIED